VVNEGVEDLATRRLGGFIAVIVADVLEVQVLVLQREVVPVFAPYEDTGVALKIFEKASPLLKFK
jgi:hypothetical protein